MEHNTLKSTRLRGAIVVWLAGNLFFALGMMNADQWVELTKWIFGIYSTSEGVVKGVNAYKDKV